MSVEDDKAIGEQGYREVLATAKLKDSGPEFEMVKRVVTNLVRVSDDPGFDWEVHVIDDPKTVNAWCMPGGKIAVYTGILPLTKDETGLAVVLGHEMGHAIARHGTERLSMEMGPSIAIEAFGGQNKELYATAMGLALTLPWGRKQELEADHIGVIYMARAGYDPHKALDFWQRMAAQSGGAPPEFLSTHPSDAHRIKEIEKLMPEAVKVWESASAKGPKP
jgi:predicted Zn-dependent protease